MTFVLVLGRSLQLATRLPNQGKILDDVFRTRQLIAHCPRRNGRASVHDPLGRCHRYDYALPAEPWRIYTATGRAHSSACRSAGARHGVYGRRASARDLYATKIGSRLQTSCRFRLPEIPGVSSEWVDGLQLGARSLGAAHGIEALPDEMEAGARDPKAWTIGRIGTDGQATDVRGHG